MRVQKSNVYEILSDERICIRVPVYQRKYTWNIKHCEDLVNDIKKISRTSKPHFFGSVVFYKDDNELLIIDGQQRITTASLILIAIRDLMKEDAFLVDNKTECFRKIDSLLTRQSANGSRTSKLIPFRDDLKTYTSILEGKKIPDNNKNTGNLYNNYQAIKNEIVSIGKPVEELLDYFKLLEIVNITLEIDDNPQEVFESLNSTGVILSESDKVRNFILMGISKYEQEDWYEKYWSTIQSLAGGNIDDFIKCYLNVKTDIIRIQRSDIYRKFKEYIYSNNYYKDSRNLEEFLKEMVSYAHSYNAIMFFKTPVTEDNIILRNLAKLGALQDMGPFLVTIYHMQVCGAFDEPATFSKILSDLESYFIRVSVCKKKGGLRSAFESMPSRIRDFDEETKQFENYEEKTRYCLMNKMGKSCYPNDKEFLDILTSVDLYKTKPLALYILKELERKLNHSYRPELNYVIDHILPSKENKAWRQDLGSTAYDSALKRSERLGNLTLTDGASPITEATFFKKKTADTYGYLNTGLRINKYFENINVWNAERIDKRGKDLGQQSLEMWSIKEVQYKPRTEKVLFDLNYDIENDPRSVIKLNIGSKKYDVYNWKDVLITFCKHLYNNDTLKLEEISKYEELSDIFSSSKDTNTYIKISDDIYVKGVRNQSSIIDIIRKLTTYVGMDFTDVTVKFQQAAEKRNYQIKHQEQFEKSRLLKVGCKILNAQYGYGELTEIDNNSNPAYVYILFEMQEEEKQFSLYYVLNTDSFQIIDEKKED